VVAAGVTWLGQASRTILVATPDESQSGKWTRSEKILLAGVLINVIFLIYEIRKGGSNAVTPLAGPGL
jgi:hypothetical protein